MDAFSQETLPPEMPSPAAPAGDAISQPTTCLGAAGLCGAASRDAKDGDAAHSDDSGARQPVAVRATAMLAHGSRAGPTSSSWRRCSRRPGVSTA